jgi:hypothetical protein
MKQLLKTYKQDQKMTPPKCIFQLSNDMMHTMIKANCLYSSTESKGDFLLRFAMIEDQKKMSEAISKED